MLMWVCRQGKNANYESLFYEKGSIFLAWEGYHINLLSFKNKDDLREFIINEKSTNNRTSISNWMGQIIVFSKEMKQGDYVLLPGYGSRSYNLALITGDYQFRAFEDINLYHSRRIDYLYKNIPRDIFEQDIIYSLGAYRTVFKVRQQERVIEAINKYIKNRTV